MMAVGVQGGTERHMRICTGGRLPRYGGRSEKVEQDEKQRHGEYCLATLMQTVYDEMFPTPGDCY